MESYLTLAEAVTIALAARHDGRGNKQPIVDGLRAAERRADESDVPPEAFYGEPLDPADAKRAAADLIQ